MAGHSNAVGRKGFLKKKYEANKAQGEKLNGSEYKMTFPGYPNLETLIRTAQIPMMQREDVEDFGPNGVKFSQYGPLTNSGEIQVQCVETLTGEVCKMVVDVVANKKYLDISLQASAESLAGDAVAAHKFELLDCRIAMDQVDLSTEDVTTLVRPSLRIIYNWVDNEADDLKL